jgi:hypothetical protein
MENMGTPFELPKFNSPEEELKYLRERVAQKEQQIWKESEPAQKEAVISAEVIAYAKETPTARLEEHLILENPQFESVLGRLGSLPHREKVRELYRMLAEKGILNAIKVAEAQNNPHIEEDFHRVLVEYVKTGGQVPGMDKERTLMQSLKKTVYEVTLPFAGSLEGAQQVTYKDVIVSMERFYVGMIPQKDGNLSAYGPITLELVLSNFSNDIVFFATVEDHMKDLFVKQLLGAFPMAKIEENPADFNIFNEFGVSVGSAGVPQNNFVYPIEIAEESGQDPLGIILNAFTNIAREGEGAAVQIIFFPDEDHLDSKVKHAIGQIRQGVPASRATNIPLSTSGVITKSLTEFFHTQIKDKKKDDKLNGREQELAEQAGKLMEEKLRSPLVRANMRIVVSASTRDRAESIRTALEASYSQFTRQHGGGIRFENIAPKDLPDFFHHFTYRLIDQERVLVWNTKELAHVYHLPLAVSQKDAPQLKTVKASSAPAPADLPSEGTLLGRNTYRGTAREVRLTKADRLRHLYVIGQTGTGKSVFLKNLVVQDILAGNGACFIDPHGSDVQDVLAAIPPERLDDVIYFDPSYTARPFALNMLEYDVTHPEQKIFVVNEMLAIFKKLYASTPEAMGPAFEQYFRNATMLVMEDPESGNTLLEIPRVMADANFRNMKLANCKNPIVVQFWRDIATKTSGESGLQNMIPYITNKFDVFISNDIMRPIIAQEKSSFNFRDIMDNKKILLVNLAKGKLGEMNANLLGLIIIGKFLMAAMSRVDSFGKQLPDFYLYVDEFQNVATPSISAILSEARKYGLSLNLAHQFIAQLPEDIKGAVFGNVGNMVTFRVGAEDAQFLESQFAPVFKASDIMKIENRNAYAKILINGKPVSPFNVEMIAPPQGHPEIIEQLRNLSYLKYGRDRKTVDDAILARYMAAQSASQSPTLTPTQPAPVVRPPQPRPLPVAPPVPVYVPPVSTPTSPDPVSSVTPLSPVVTHAPFAQAFARATLTQEPTQPLLPVSEMTTPSPSSTIASTPPTTSST